MGSWVSALKLSGISIKMMLNALILCLFFTATSLVNSMTTFGPNQVGANFCCREDERLVVDEEPGKTKAQCVQIGDEAERSSLEGREVWVGGEDGDDREMKRLKLLEVKNLDCQRGLVLTTLIMNQAAQNVSLTPYHPSVLTSGGDLQIKKNRWTERFMTTYGWTERTRLSHINAGDFCLAPLAQDSGDGDGLVALFCDTCAAQVACSYARDTFYFYLVNDWRTKRKIIRKDRNQGRRALSELFLSVCDTNGDDAVDFEEFFDRLKFYIRTAFEVLDENEDGSILDEAKDGNIFKSISYPFFETLLNQVFEFFDSNKDGTLSVEDDIFFFDDIFECADSEWFELNQGGPRHRITCTDALDRFLISLPAPIYNLYTKLDRDTDKRLTKAEVLGFMTRLFTLIDGKGSIADCKIDVTEVLQLFDQPANPLEVPWDYRLALKILLDQKLTLVSHLVKAHVERADKDKDNKVTVEEILEFDDFEFLDTEYIAVEELFYALLSIKYLAYGPHYCCMDAAPAMWLTALQNVIAQPIFFETGEARRPPGCTP